MAPGAAMLGGRDGQVKRNLIVNESIFVHVSNLASGGSMLP
jgi:hypothetical protein